MYKCWFSFRLKISNYHLRPAIHRVCINIRLTYLSLSVCQSVILYVCHSMWNTAICLRWWSTSLWKGYTVVDVAPGIETTKNSFRSNLSCFLLFSCLQFFPLWNVQWCMPERFEELWGNAKPDTRPPTSAWILTQRWTLLKQEVFYLCVVMCST